MSEQKKLQFKERLLNDNVLVKAIKSSNMFATNIKTQIFYEVINLAENINSIKIGDYVLISNNNPLSYPEQENTFIVKINEITFVRSIING